jgi:hypothetical protein
LLIYFTLTTAPVASMEATPLMVTVVLMIIIIINLEYRKHEFGWKRVC